MVAKPTLYVLGGNPTISEMLRRKSNRLRNFVVVVVDSRRSAPAHQYADQSIYEDPRTFIQEQNVPRNAKVLPTASDISAEAFLLYCEKQKQCDFDLTGWSSLLDKTTMVRLLDPPGKRARLLYSTTSTDVDLKGLIDHNTESEKFVVKPNKASGGRGFKVVARDTNLEAVLNQAAADSLDGHAVLETYIQIRHQFCGDMYVLNQSIQAIFVGDGIWNHNQGLGFPIGEVFPTRKGHFIQSLKSELHRLLSKLNITEGVFNFDAVLDDVNDVRILEMTPRPGGNHLSYAASLAEGFDFENEYLKYFLGLEDEVEPMSVYQTAIVTMVHSTKPTNPSFRSSFKPAFHLSVPYENKPTDDAPSSRYIGATITGFEEYLGLADCSRFRNFSETEFRNLIEDV